MFSRHPHVERVMQEQVRQQRTDDSSLRRSRRARHDAAIFQLHWRFQPAFDVEQYPCAIRMVTDRPEQQLPINAVKESAHVEIEHPVVAPAALTSGLHGIDCRLTGSVAIGIWMELRLQNGLQISTDNSLGDPVSDCWDTQRSHAAVRLWN